jgi:guanosine-3',5'-bis(diphosphate) 3'-pyrophosphohydrolase
MEYLSKLEKIVSTYLDESALVSIKKAYDLAEKAHEGQFRKSGEPYIMHPVAVATTLAELGMDADAVIAALLHDVIEDTTVTKYTLRQEFGDSVADLVDGVSKLTHISFGNKIEAQAENTRKMILAMSKDIRVILVKLADRLHNMETLQAIAPEKKRAKARETLDIYVPIAARLGMHKFHTRLEDLCFWAMYPLRAKILEQHVRKVRGQHREIIGTIESLLENECKKHELKYFKVEGREKHLASIYRKMAEKRILVSDIMDVYGFRIIVDSREDCYRVLCYVHSLYKPLPDRFKDYIALPKANGYQSLHTTLFGTYGIPVEIQIRTREMHDMAENGIAAHWLYKTPSLGKITEAHIQAQTWMKNLLEMQKNSSNSAEFLENVKIDLFPDEVYVFTPKGKILELPKGSTAIDFAYSIHSDIGDKCMAVKIDRQYALLSTSLMSGQTVEILTADNVHPNLSWLDFAATGRARAAIRHYFKRDHNHELLALDQEWLDQAMHNNMKALTIKGDENSNVKFAECCHPIPGDVIVGQSLSNGNITVHIGNCATVNTHSNRPKEYISLCWDKAIDKDFLVTVAVDINNKPGVLADISKAMAQYNSSVEDLDMQNLNEAYRRLVFLITVKNLEQLNNIIKRVKNIINVVNVERV